VVEILLKPGRGTTTTAWCVRSRLCPVSVLPPLIPVAAMADNFYTTGPSYTLCCTTDLSKQGAANRQLDRCSCAGPGSGEA